VRNGEDLKPIYRGKLCIECIYTYCWVKKRVSKGFYCPLMLVKIFENVF